MSLVTLTNLNKSYFNQQIETKALIDVNLTIEAGDFITITGPSGCGKSTLLSILGLMDSADSGSYQLANIQAQQLSHKQATQVRNKHIGFVFQSFNLIDSLSVYDNIALPLEYRGEKSSTIKQQVEQVLTQVDMLNRQHYRPNQLSGGQQQRVAIARALVGKPDLILVDEPTGNLDSQNGDQVMALLTQLNQQGSTIVMVTHDSRYASFAKRHIHMLDGKIISEQTITKSIKGAA